jgi:hypothetical protein
MTDGAGPRTLADDLRARDDGALAALLRARPDLISPVPTDMTKLVARAATRTSVVRALDHLNRFALQVVDALVCLPDPTPYDAVRELVPADGAALRAVLDDLRDQALVWGPDDALRAVRTLREVVGPAPAETGPPVETLLHAAYSPSRLQHLLIDLDLPPTPDSLSAVDAIGARFADSGWLAAVLENAPAEALELLGKLTWGPVAGEVDRADREVRVATAATPVEWLLARALLVATNSQTVALPRQVALHLRGGRLHREVAAQPPELAAQPHDPAASDRTAAGQAFSAVSRLEELLDTWSLEPPAMLRSGGLGVRDLRRMATAMDLDEHLTTLVAEVAYAAGLLATTNDVDEVWLPTPAYDRWRARAPAERWAALVAAWLDSTRVPGLAGGRDARDRPLTALSPELDRALAPGVRLATLDALASLPPGVATTADSVHERLRWQRPRHGGRLRRHLVAWTLREAEFLGVTGRGALASYSRPLLHGDTDAAAAILAPLLPEPLDHVLIQADLTAIAPGPLVRELAAELALAADVESTGGATVYRFTESSVRRALDAGRSAADLHDLLTTHSRTPVPQPLSYLVDDVARRHGRIRVGAASAYLRCDDDAVLTELLGDRRAAGLGLRRLAPSVLVAQAPADVLLERLREMGYAPAAEAPDGALLLRRPDARRTGPRQRPPRLVAEPPAPTPTLVTAAVRAIRAGDRAATATRRPLAGVPGDTDTAAGEWRGRLPRLTTGETLLRLRAAANNGVPLWIGYVDNHGSASDRVVDPIAVEGGYLTAYDHRLDRVHTFAVHRITGVAAVDASP